MVPRGGGGALFRTGQTLSPSGECVSLIKANSYFSDLPEKDLYRLCADSTEVTYAPGHEIVREGDPAGDCFVILTGCVHVTADGEDGRRIVLNRLSRGAIFGEQPLLLKDTTRRTATVRAVDASRIFQIRRAAFGELLLNHPQLRRSLLERKQDHDSWNQARRLGLIERFSDDSRHGIERVVAHFQRGETIFREGDEPNNVYIVLKGRARVDRGGQTLTVLRPGRFFGELAVLDNQKRRATVWAEQSLEVQVISGETFVERYEASESLKRYFGAVRNKYALREGEPLTEHWSRVDRADWVHTSRTASDGASLAICYEPNEALVVCGVALSGASMRARSLQRFEFRSPFLDVDRRLWVDESGRLVGAEVRGAWGQLINVFDAILRGETPDADVLRAFEQDGRLHMVGAGSTAERVCLCLDVDRAEVVKSVANGCRTVADIGAKLGCGTACGACVPRIRALLDTQLWQSVEAQFQLLSKDVMSIRLTRDDGVPLESGEPGQHIVLSAFVEGRWLDRPYTVISTGNGDGSLEIAVKREPLGRLSQWLFDPAAGPRRFRVSRPQGGVSWSPSLASTVCFSAGIGITPAIAILRNVRAMPSSATALVLDCSFRDREQAAFFEELRPDQDRDNVEIEVRWTARDGRVTAAEVRRHASRHPTAMFLICGPNSYINSVATTLKESGIAETQIRAETFTPTSVLTRMSVPPWLNAPSPDELRDPLPHPIPVSRHVSYWLGLTTAFLALLILPSSFGESMVVPGPPNTGHQNLLCSDCHKSAPGTTRQQLQANVQHWLGRREDPVAFGFLEVDNQACESCHERPNDAHPVFRFVEPRFSHLRTKIGPDRCTSCHWEHEGVRSQASPEVCRHCHEEVAFDDDPLDVPHQQLVDEGRWYSCLGCHDYHGNHEFQSPHKVSDAIVPSAIDAYLGGASSPYGEPVYKSFRRVETEDQRP